MTLRVAILGSGMIGGIHRRAAILAGANVVGVMSSSPARSEEAAHAWGTEPIRSFDELAVLDADVVHVCTPNAQHVEQTAAALSIGAHVICEKPLATSSDQAEALAASAATAARVATVPFVYRYHPLVREVRARVRAGEFGAWQLLHGSYLQDWLLSPRDTNWRVESALGGPSRTFADIGSHWCDLMEFVTGERIESVIADFTTTVPRRPHPASDNSMPTRTLTVDTEDAASVLFRTASNVLGAVTVSQVSAGRRNRLWFEFDGASASAVFDQEFPETVWMGGQSQDQVLHRSPSVGSADARRLSSLPPGHAQGYAQCFESFVADTYDAVLGNPRDGLPTFDDGARSARIVDAVIESARTGTRVTVADSPVTA